MKNQFKKIVDNALNKIGDKSTAYQIEQIYKRSKPSEKKIAEITEIRRKYEENLVLSAAEYNLEMNNLAEKHKRLDHAFLKDAMDKELAVLKRNELKEIKIIDKKKTVKVIK